MMLIFTGALIGDGDVFGQDRDAAFAFEIVAVENLIPDELGFAVTSALMQHAIDQAGFAVVDVCDDGHIADVGATHGDSTTLGERWGKASKPISIADDVEWRQSTPHSVQDNCKVQETVILSAAKNLRGIA